MSVTSDRTLRLYGRNLSFDTAQGVFLENEGAAPASELPFVFPIYICKSNVDSKSTSAHVPENARASWSTQDMPHTLQSFPLEEFIQLNLLTAWAKK